VCVPLKGPNQVYETLTSRQELSCIKSKKREPKQTSKEEPWPSSLPLSLASNGLGWHARELELVKVLSAGIYGSWSILALVRISATTSGSQHSGGPPAMLFSDLLGQLVHTS